MFVYRLFILTEGEPPSELLKGLFYMPCIWLFGLQPNVERMVSIQIGVNGISWARLRSSEVAEMEVWDILDLSDSMDKKYDIHSVWSLVSMYTYSYFNPF